jgi:tetratricopeptide (TPR) repeat protein
MNRYLFIVLILTFVFSSLSFGNVQDRRNQLLGVINEELHEVGRLNKQTGSRRPSLLLRMAELWLEKARLIKEEENEKYLQLPQKKRNKVSKRKMFKKSNHAFIKAQKICKYMLKRFKRFKGKGDVFYILAFNAKEFQKNSKARKYFTLAIRYSPRGSPIRIKSQLALAEIYFNAGDFRRALNLYKGSVGYKKDKWYTKDLYNVAWCYFRTGKKTTAIKKMNKVYNLSKDPNYIDLSVQAKRDLAYFYTDAGRTKEAVGFYKKTGGNISANMLKVAKHLQDQGKYAAAEKVLVDALKYKQNDAEEIEMRMNLLTVYDKFGRNKKHLETVEALQSFNRRGLLPKENVEVLKYHAQKMAGVLQKQVLSKTYRRQKKTRHRKARMAIRHFAVLGEMNPKKNHEAIFNSAETLFAAGLYNDAIDYYDKALAASHKVGSKKYAALALNGMMASLGQKGVSKKSKDKYLVHSWLSYLKKNPRSKKSFKIYQRLFSTYYDKKDMTNAENTLYAFKKNFPKAVKTQEAMLARVMDYYKNKKDGAAIKAWVQKINSGEFVVSKKYANKLRVLLLTMQFEGVEKANSSGQKKKALKGYVMIYRSPHSSESAKKNAAYNIAVLFHEMRDIRRTYLWLDRALSLMGAKDVLKFQDSFLTIAAELFSRNRFAESADIYEKVLAKICKRKSHKKKLFFKNAIVIYLADQRIEEARHLIRKSKQCRIPKSYVTDANMDILKSLVETQRWNSFKDLFGKLEKQKRLWGELIYPLSSLYMMYQTSGKHAEARKAKNKMLRFYKHASSRRQDIPLEGLDVIASIKMQGLSFGAAKLDNIKLQYPEKRFNRLLQKKVKQLDRLTAKALEIFKIRSGKGIVKAYQYLVQSYRKVVEEIKAFTPPGKSPEYVKSFKKSMNALVRPIAKKADEFLAEAKKKIYSSKILSPDNKWFLGNEKIPIPIEYDAPAGGVIMDRGGAK